MSAKESNCLPNSPVTLRILAKKPSKKSKKTPSKTKLAVSSNLACTAKIVANVPENKLPSVKIFGMCFLICISLKLEH